MSKKVLIVDDEEGIRESLKLILSDHYEIMLTDGGEFALELLNNDPKIGLVLLDIKMRKVHGLDVLKEIKARHSHVKVIMVTGYKSVETAMEASKLGADGYVIKPFKSEEILASVKNNLR